MAESNKDTQPKGNERRASVRHPFRWDLNCELTGAATARTARINDISPEGLSLLLTAPVDAGAMLEVILRCPEESLTYALAMRVCHARQQADGNWLIGCSFVNPTDYQVVKSQITSNK